VIKPEPGEQRRQDAAFDQLEVAEIHHKHVDRLDAPREAGRDGNDRDVEPMDQVHMRLLPPTGARVP
jgi:hypothetical protein